MMNPMLPEDELPLPEACALTLEAVAANPLDPGAEAEAHLRTCAACAEARVMLLTQEETTTPLVPAGYFESLPSRVSRKLPSARPARRGLPVWIWAAAAAVLMAAGVGGYLAGRATPAPPMLLPMARQTAPVDLSNPDQSLPFQDRDDDLAEIGTMSPSELKELVSKLEPAKPKGTTK